MSNTRLCHLLILAATSLGIAVACFFVGGMIAEAASHDPIMGITFKAGGSLAGFLISFVVLFVSYQKLKVITVDLMVAVSPHSGSFVRTENAFKAKTTVRKYSSGAKTELDTDAIWAAGNLTVHLRDIEQDDLVMIRITDGNGGSWESDFFSPLCPEITLS